MSKRSRILRRLHKGALAISVLVILSCPTVASAQVDAVSINYVTLRKNQLRIEVTGVQRECSDVTPATPIEVFLRNGPTRDTVTYQCEEWDASLIEGRRWFAETAVFRPRIDIRVEGKKSGLRRFRFRVRVDGVAIDSGSISIRTRYHRARKISERTDVDSFINVCINENRKTWSENKGWLYCWVGGWTERTWRVNGRIIR